MYIYIYTYIHGYDRAHDVKVMHLHTTVLPQPRGANPPIIGPPLISRMEKNCWSLTINKWRTQCPLVDSHVSMNFFTCWVVTYQKNTDDFKHRHVAGHPTKRPWLGPAHQFPGISTYISSHDLFPQFPYAMCIHDDHGIPSSSVPATFFEIRLPYSSQKVHHRILPSGSKSSICFPR